MRPYKVVIVVNVALAVGFLAGYLWQQSELERFRREGALASPPGAAAGTGRGASARGIVRDVRRATRDVLITHEPLTGIMGAMTMAFPAADPALLEGLAVGDRVRFTLETRQGRLVLTELRPDGS